MAIVKSSISKKMQGLDSLKIKSRIHLGKRQGKIEFSGHLLRFIDKDTNQYVYYVPALEVTSYGSTEQRAREMLDAAVESLFQYSHI